MHEITRTTTRTAATEEGGPAGRADRDAHGSARTGDRGAVRTARRRSGPPGRRDSRRPGGATVRRPDSAPGGATAPRPGAHGATRPGGVAGRTAAVSRTAAIAAVRRERDQLPHYWFAHRLLLAPSTLCSGTPSRTPTTS
jgi:hypothetical protein